MSLASLERQIEDIRAQAETARNSYQARTTEIDRDPTLSEEGQRLAREQATSSIGPRLKELRAKEDALINAEYELPPGLAMRDSVATEKDAAALAALVVTDGEFGDEFQRILETSESREYAAEVAGMAVARIVEMIVTGDLPSSLTPSHTHAIGRFVIDARMRAAMWRLKQISSHS